MNAPAEPLEPQLENMIAAARAGSPEALGRLLEICRPYLLKVANAELDSQLVPKAGGSDMVQEAFLEAQRIFARFQSDSSGDLLAWLRAILLNKMATFTRQFQGTEKRQVAREQFLDAASTPPEIPTDTPSPSSIVARDEQAEKVNRALSRLPEEYRQVIQWRQWEELPFDEIARHLGKSVDAARMVWWRAIERLEKEMEADL